jgi:hypothetical protein
LISLSALHSEYTGRRIKSSAVECERNGTVEPELTGTNVLVLLRRLRHGKHRGVRLEVLSAVLAGGDLRHDGR